MLANTRASFLATCYYGPSQLPRSACKSSAAKSVVGPPKLHSTVLNNRARVTKLWLNPLPFGGQRQLPPHMLYALHERSAPVTNLPTNHCALRCQPPLQTVIFAPTTIDPVL